MNYDFHNKYPMQLVELNMNLINDNNPHLITALDKSVHHAIIRNYKHFPFNQNKFLC